VVINTNHCGWVYLDKTLVSYDDYNIPTIDEEGKIGVKEKQYIFQKKKKSVRHYDRSMPRIEKLLF
jgi:hypothetical protein